MGRKNGSLGGAHPTDVLGQVMMQLLARNDLASATVDQVVGGCINKVAAQGMNVTRTAWLAHGGAMKRLASPSTRNAVRHSSPPH